MAAPTRRFFPRIELPLPSANGNGKGRPALNGAKSLNVDPSVYFVPIDANGHTVDIRGAATRNWYRVAWLAYACMSYRATKISEPAVWIKEEKDGDEVWLEGNHELATLLKRPNPDMRMRAFIERTSLYLDATGRCVWVKVRDRVGRVAALRPFSDDHVLKTEAADGRFFGRFRILTADGPKWYDAEDVIHLHNEDPADPRDVVAPLDAALDELLISRDLKQSIRARLRNAVVPGMVISFPADVPLSEDQQKEFKASLALQYETARNHGKSLVLGGGVTASRQDMGLKGIEGGRLMDEIEAAVCACFQVPPVIIGAHVGIENSSDRHNLETSRELFYENAVEPVWTRIEEALTDELLAEVDPNPLRFVRFVRSQVKAYQEDVAEKVATAKEAEGFLSLDEQRALAGYDAATPEQREEILARRQSAAAPPAPTAPQPAKSAAPPEVKADRTRWALVDALVRGQEGAWEIAAHAQLDAERTALTRIASEIRQPRKDDPPIGPVEEWWVAEMIRRAVEYIDEEAAPAWKERVLTLIRRGGQLSVETMAAELGVSFDLLQPGLLAFVESHSAELVAQVTSTTKDAIRSALSAGLEAGESIPEITKRIQESGAFARSRAELIARTETIGAHNGAAVESLRTYAAESGDRFTKRWLTAHDERVRASHAAIDGETVAIDAAFSNGLQAPGEPNCRCVLTYQMEAAA